MGKKGHEVDNDWRNISSLGGSHAITTTKELIAAVAGKKTKVYALTISTLVVTLDNIVRFTDGSGGDVLYEAELGTGLQVVHLPPGLMRYFETTVNAALHIKLSAAQKVTYSISYYQDV